MFSFFEQPYTLTVAAVLTLFGMVQFRSIFPEKRRWWQLLVPLVLAAAAFGMDFVVQTDLEKIKSTIKTGMKAVADEDYNAIAQIISDNYSDSHHSTKERLLAHCRRSLSQNPVAKNKKTGAAIELSESDATAIVFMLTTFDESSYVAENYKPFLFIKTKLNLQKQPDKRWLISRIEVLELDRQPVNWSHIK